jgi:hypothetical protein
LINSTSFSAFETAIFSISSNFSSSSFCFCSASNLIFSCSCLSFSSSNFLSKNDKYSHFKTSLVFGQNAHAQTS